MFLNSSIAKKQTVALTGLLLILFIILHLAGNLLIYGGPRLFNAYAHRLHSMGPLLLLARLGLFAVFIIHVTLTFSLVWDNIKARGGHKRYAVDKSVGQRSLAEKIMPWSGLYIFIYLIFHIFDFAMADQHGPLTYLYGKSYGLYGLVYNTFKNPVHGLLYIVAIVFLGMHLSHGVQSMVQTSGFRPSWVSAIKKGSNYFAVFMTISFSSFPIYIYYLSH